MHDITVFRGGKKEQNKSEWDHSALYFQLKDNEKCVADSGYAGEPEKIVMTKLEQSTELKEFLARCRIVKRRFIGTSRHLISLVVAFAMEQALSIEWSSTGWLLMLLSELSNTIMRMVTLLSMFAKP